MHHCLLHQWCLGEKTVTYPSWLPKIQESSRWWSCHRKLYLQNIQNHHWWHCRKWSGQAVPCFYHHHRCSILWHFPYHHCPHQPWLSWCYHRQRGNGPSKIIISTISRDWRTLLLLTQRVEISFFGSSWLSWLPPQWLLPPPPIQTT